MKGDFFMKPTVIAVVGCGRIANNAHFPAFEQIPEVRVKYACDILPEKAEAAKAKFPKIEQTVADYRTVLADPEVDAVWVLTPNDGHYTVAIDALRAGKHVLCEKPAAVDYAHAAEMAAEAEKQGKMLNIGVCNRFHRSVEKLQQMNARGEFGKIYQVVCSFRSSRSIPGLGGAFTTKAHSGGGALIDWGVHFLDLIFYVLGGVKLETATCDCYSEMAKNMKDYKYKFMWAEDTADVEHGTNDVEDFVTGYLRTDKANISLNGAWAQNLPGEEMYIDFLGDKKGARLQYGKLFQIFDGQTLETTQEEYEIPNMYLCEDRAFVEAYQSGEPNRSNIREVLQSSLAMQALYDSAAKHREVVL